MATADVIQTILGSTGNGVSWVTEKIIKWIASLGVNITPLQSKILTFLILGGFIYIVWSFVNLAKKPLKWLLILALIFLLVSVGYSMFI